MASSVPEPSTFLPSSHLTAAQLYDFKQQERIARSEENAPRYQSELSANAPVITTQPTAGEQMGMKNWNIQWPNCGKDIKTRFKTRAMPSAYVCAIAIASLGFICGFCCIPFAMKNCNHYDHSCPECKHPFGTYTPPDKFTKKDCGEFCSLCCSLTLILGSGCDS